MKPVLQTIFFLVFISISATAQIGAKVQQQGKIYGLWQNSQFGYQMTLMLNPNGTGEFDGESIKFSTQAAKLTIIVGTVVTEYNFNLQGNSLTLSGGDLDGPVTFARSGSAPQDAPIAKTPTDPVFPAYSNTASNLIGLWSGNGEMIEFRPDGKCVYLGNTLSYQISQGHIILATGQGNAMFAYTVSGSQLTLIANGQRIIYNKVDSPSSTGTQNNAGTKGSVAMELVGEWCYMNMNTNSQTSRCIVFNADGTYTYSSESSRSVNTDTFSGGTASQGGDRGTWYVQGDRIYYNSQSKGQGSYRFEKRNHPKNVNDPMIVVEGESYVTTTSRAPWRY